MEMRGKSKQRGFGTSVVAIRCASNHDIVIRYPLVIHPHTENIAKDVCDRMNKEVELSKPLRNCDRFSNANEALEAFEKEKGETMIEFIRWLFAEAKGHQVN